MKDTSSLNRDGEKTSDCCNSTVTVQGDETHYYSCDNCNKPCDVSPNWAPTNQLNRDWEEKLKSVAPFTYSRVESLVRTLLEEAKASERKRCLEALPEIEEFANCEDDANFNYGWNSYRNQAISAINNKR